MFSFVQGQKVVQTNVIMSPLMRRGGMTMSNMTVGQIDCPHSETAAESIVGKIYSLSDEE